MCAEVSLSVLGEFGLIEQIRARFQQPVLPELGIGDDAALLTPSPGMQLLVSTDLLAEGVHFDRTFTPPRLLGRKALAVNLSDLAAMGARPRWFFLSLAIPSPFPLGEIEEILDGLAEQAAAHDCVLAGGDTCGSKSGLLISITVLGEQSLEHVLRRSGAVPGDDVWVSGTLGDSALGLHLLQKGQRLNGEGTPIARHLDPVPRLLLGRELAEAGLAHAMIDISDGLLADLGHICRQSGCGAELALEKLPLSEQFRIYAAEQKPFPWQMAVSGGEDYELCFTAPTGNRAAIHEIGKKSGVLLTVVGKVTSCGQVRAKLPDGAVFAPSASGYTHF